MSLGLEYANQRHSPPHHQSFVEDLGLVLNKFTKDLFHAHGLQTWDVDCTVNEFLLFQFRSRTTFVLAGCISMWLCGTPCASDGMFDPRAF